MSDAIEVAVYTGSPAADGLISWSGVRAWPLHAGYCQELWLAGCWVAWCSCNSWVSFWDAAEFLRDSLLHQARPVCSVGALRGPSAPSNGWCLAFQCFFTRACSSVPCLHISVLKSQCMILQLCSFFLVEGESTGV